MTIEGGIPKLSRRGLLAAGVVYLGGPTVASPLPNSLLNTLPASAWQDDVSYLFDELHRRHRDLFHHTPEEKFREAVRTLRRSCPSMADWQIIAGIQTIVSLAGDGHSFLFTKDLYRAYPFEVAWFGDEVRVVRISPVYASLLGARIERIDGLRWTDICRRLDAVIAQAETPWYVLSQRPERLRRAELLAALGIAQSPERITVTATDRRGDLIKVVIEPMPHRAPDDQLSLALGPRMPDQPDAGFGWRRLEAGAVVHLAFRSYEDLPRKAAVFFQDLRAAPPRALLIDLRENSGGNYTLPREHLIAPLQEIPALNRAGRLFVLIGRKTFSAAMTNATDFRRETEALLVGEPAGARPNGFQELQTFTLPHSKLKVGCSTAAYRFGAPVDSAVSPDLAAEPDWATFRSARDAAVEVSLRHWRANGGV